MWAQINIHRLQKAGKEIYSHCADQPAEDISRLLNDAADEILWLRYQLKRLKKGIVQLSDFANLNNPNQRPFSTGDDFESLKESPKQAGDLPVHWRISDK